MNEQSHHSNIRLQPDDNYECDNNQLLLVKLIITERRGEMKVYACIRCVLVARALCRGGGGGGGGVCRWH